MFDQQKQGITTQWRALNALWEKIVTNCNFGAIAGALAAMGSASRTL